jgi:hypothetical protein
MTCAITHGIKGVLVLKGKPQFLRRKHRLAAGSPRMLVDFASRSIHVTTLAAKAIIRA